MASSKWSFIYLVFLLIAAVTLVKADDFFDGKRDPLKDKLRCVYSESLPAVPGKVSERSGLTCTADTGKTISYVAVWDLSPQGKSNSVIKITAGGINKPYVTLLIQTEIGKGLDYSLKVFEK